MPLGLAAALLGQLLSPGAEHTQYSQKQLQETFSRHLNGESLRPEINASGSVRFRNQAPTFVIHVDERDPLCLCLTLAFGAEDKSAEHRQRLLEACNVATAEVKVVKCFLDELGDPTFAGEMFLVVLGDFTLHLDRLLRAMGSAQRRFSRRLGELR